MTIKPDHLYPDPQRSAGLEQSKMIRVVDPRGPRFGAAITTVVLAVVPAPEFSTYPVAKEDVALQVPVEVAAADVASTLREGAGPLCESVRLFDVYTGEQVGEGRKSLAFALRFRAPDRTLTEAETGEARAAAVALAAERHGAVQR